MKKILLGTSAVALAGASATSANAAEWDVDVGGFFNAWAVYTSEDDDLVGSGGDGFDILTNAEIIFTPTITLDNGLQFGAKVEMEAEADGSAQSGAVDESVLFVEGGFGRLELGAEDSAFGRMGICSPTNGPAGVCSGTLTGTFLAGDYGAFQSSGGGFANQLAGDAVRINYFTPRFAGFQVGASYARGTSRDDRFFEDRDGDGDLRDIISFGANYRGDFGGFSLNLAGTFETATANDTAAVAGRPGIVAGVGGNQAFIRNDTQQAIANRLANNPNGVQLVEIVPSEAGSSAVAGDDPTQYHLGASVGFSGVTIGGGYAHYERNNGETDFFDLGIGYSTGPWGVSLGGSLTEHDNIGEATAIALNGTYNLGPGVNAVAYAGYAEFDADGGASVDGFSIGTGIHLGF